MSIVNNLPNYTEENREPLISKSVLGAETLKYIEFQTGCKGDTAINLLNTAVEFGDGRTCGWNEAGTSTLSERVIKPAVIKVNMSFCDKAMLKSWTRSQVNIAAGRSTLPFEEEFCQGIINDIQSQLDNFIWNGKNIGGTEYKGILDLITDDGVEATVVAEAGVYAKVKGLFNAIPAEGLKDSAIFLGIDAFRVLVAELTEKNLYHYDPKVDEAFTIVLPGTNTMVHGVSGLNASNKAVALNVKHTFYGTDLEGDDETFKIWYSDDNQEYRFACNFVAGVNYAFADEVKWVSLV